MPDEAPQSTATEPTQIPAVPESAPLTPAGSEQVVVVPEATTPIVDIPVSTEMPEVPISAPANVVEERPLAYPPMADSGRPEDSPQRQDLRSFLAKALEKIQFRKRVKLEKIMKFAQGRKEITNDQIEKLLHISDSTAQRYLIQLAKEGKLKRIGKDGSSRYEPLNGSFSGN